MSFFPARNLQLSLALIKPHLAKIPYAVDDLHNRLLTNGFLIVRSRRSVMDESDAKTFYAEHEQKPFYPSLISMITSGPVVSLIIAREDCINKWREMMGPTRSYEAHFTDPETVRGRYGLTNTCNAVHGSGSAEDFGKEAPIVFPNFNPDTWYRIEEIHFRNGYVTYDPHKGVHSISNVSPFPRGV